MEAPHLKLQLQSHTMETFVPPTRRPNVRTAGTKPVDMDMYGYRPLRAPWIFLSPYEFLMRWRGEPLLTPTEYVNRGNPTRTTWTALGAALVRTAEYKKGKVVAKPGVHYVVIEPEDTTYSTFPEEPRQIFEIFRHSWVLVRKKRPDVVVIEGLKLPSLSRTAVENAKYCNLFFRPWTNLTGTAVVPHISLLGCNREMLERVYLGQAAKCSEAGPTVAKQTRIRNIAHSVPNCMDDQVHWSRAWDEYVRGHVVSETAAHLIQSFLLKTMAVSGGNADNEEDEADKSEDETEITPLRISRMDLQSLLAPLDENENAETGDVDKGRKRRKGANKWCLQAGYGRSMSIGLAVWCTPASDVAAGDRGCAGNIYQKDYEKHIDAKRVKEFQVGEGSPRICIFSDVQICMDSRRVRDRPPGA